MEIVVECLKKKSIGATAIACKETNRKFIGCEIDEEYFEISKRRLEGKPLED